MKYKPRVQPSCENCVAACCKGPLIMELAAEELAFMKNANTEFLTIAEPEDFDRQDVMYPTGYTAHPRTKEFIAWETEKGRETEPLRAGFGRYLMVGACGNLTITEDGWELCGAYEDRPAVCRDFPEGGAKCLIIRKMNGLNP